MKDMQEKMRLLLDSLMVQPQPAAAGHEGDCAKQAPDDFDQVPYHGSPPPRGSSGPLVCPAGPLVCPAGPWDDVHCPSAPCSPGDALSQLTSEHGRPSGPGGALVASGCHPGCHNSLSCQVQCHDVTGKWAWQVLAMHISIPCRPYLPY